MLEEFVGIEFGETTLNTRERICKREKMLEGFVRARSDETAPTLKSIDEGEKEF
jgi:hypothetical protein